MKPIIVRRDAEVDLLDAARWYESQREGLGREFLLNVDAILHRIERDPEMFPLVHGSSDDSTRRRSPLSVLHLLRA